MYVTYKANRQIAKRDEGEGCENININMNEEIRKGVLSPDVSINGINSA